MLLITVSDDADQTRKVMKAHAASVQPATRCDIDLEPFLALQRWLRTAGARPIGVSFAQALAETVPADAVRMRRDFRQLLTTIQACAFLYQCQRTRTAEGWIEATFEDYEIVRKLVGPVFDALAADMVTPAIRATVEAISNDEEISVTDLAKRLRMSKSTAWYRVRRALAGGWLVNREPRSKQPIRLARGSTLPDAVSALPPVALIRGLCECSNGSGENVPCVC